MQLMKNLEGEIFDGKLLEFNLKTNAYDLYEMIKKYIRKCKLLRENIFGHSLSAF